MFDGEEFNEIWLRRLGGAPSRSGKTRTEYRMPAPIVDLAAGPENPEDKEGRDRDRGRESDRDHPARSP
jgi:hypothetical protein